MTVSYADNKYIKRAGDHFVGSLSMGNNRITTLGGPRDRLDAVNKEWSENTFLKRCGDNMQGDLSMGNHELTDVKDPVGLLDAANKRWVESVLPKGVWTLLTYVKGIPGNYTIYRSGDVRDVAYAKVGQDLKLTIHFNQYLPDGCYSYGMDLSKSTKTSTQVYLYGECGGSGFDCKTLICF